jgi:hypothetical protein
MKNTSMSGNGMRKLRVVVAVAAVMGVVNDWAQTTNFSQGLDVAIKGILIPSGDKVSNESLSGNTNPVSFVHLQIINGTTTNLERWIGQINASTTNLFLGETRHVDVTPKVNKDDFVIVFSAIGQIGTSSNATILVAGSETTTVQRGVTNGTVSAKIQGVWVDEPAVGDGQAIVGTMNSVRAK